MRRLSGLFALLFSSACAGPAWQQAPHDQRFQRVPAPVLHEKPDTADISDWWYTIEQTTTRPLGEVLAPIHWIDEATGGVRAHDINAFGEVLDSSWFTNRIGKRPLSSEQIARGPNTLEEPAEGPLTVLSGKLTGASPGLVVVDTDGHRFLVKFDPPAYPGLASGAELIATKILWATGYNVPENYVFRFDSKRLHIASGARAPASAGETAPLTEAHLEDLIYHANPDAQGRVTALFSRIVEGEPIGPFTYSGKRKDDPNDTIPHERRRSLRGYRWLSAWLNNTDTRASNTFDVFRPVEGDEGHVVHYLIDFGDALGSMGTQPKHQGLGYDPIFSWGVIFEQLFTAGLRYRYWLPAERSHYRSIGLFEGEVFEPERWSPGTPNPAFDEATAEDDFWAASLIARFSQEDVEAVVAKAKYRDPGAAEYIVKVLMERREKILRMAFSRVAPLVDPVVEDGHVRFTDLGRTERLDLRPDVRYRIDFKDAEGGASLASASTAEPELDLRPALRAASDDHVFFVLEITRIRRGEDQPSLQLYLRREGERLWPIGLRRESR